LLLLWNNLYLFAVLTYFPLYKSSSYDLICFSSLPLISSPIGCPALWPWQFTPAPGEGEERGVPHAPLHPPRLPVPAEGHDWGRPWKEAHGTRPRSRQAQTPGGDTGLTRRLYPETIQPDVHLCSIVHIYLGLPLIQYMGIKKKEAV